MSEHCFRPGETITNQPTPLAKAGTLENAGSF